MDMTLEAIAAAVGAHEPTRRELTQLARMQAELGVEAIKSGEIGTAKVFLVDALDFLGMIKP